MTPHYDTLLAKVCTWAGARDRAIELARAAAESFHISGPKTNLPLFAELLTTAEVRENDYDTALIDRVRASTREQERSQ